MAKARAQYDELFGKDDGDDVFGEDAMAVDGLRGDEEDVYEKDWIIDDMQEEGGDGKRDKVVAGLREMGKCILVGNHSRSRQTNLVRMESECYEGPTCIPTREHAVQG